MLHRLAAASVAAPRSESIFIVTLSPRQVDTSDNCVVDGWMYLESVAGNQYPVLLLRFVQCMPKKKSFLVVAVS